MARIRSIHPGLFTDEAFASLSMAARVLLLGLWTEADDQGIFDWKPVTLKMRVMPVDNVDVAGLLQELQRSDVIRRFEQDTRDLGAVRNFCKFQRPKTPKYRQLKSNELRNYVASKYPISEITGPDPLPFPPKVEIPRQREEGGGIGEEVEESTQEVAKARPRENNDLAFQRFKAAYPRREGANPWLPAEKKFNALVKSGADPEVIIKAAAELAREENSRGNIGTKFVPQAITWLNQQRFSDYAAAVFLAEISMKGFYAKGESEQLAAWDSWGLRTRGKTMPRDRNGGWRVDSEWPPEATGERIAPSENEDAA